MMRLSWKDAGATGLTAGVVALYAAFRTGAHVPLVSGPRVLAAVALVAGLAACAVGAGEVNANGRARWAAYTGGALGVTALLAALATLITGNGFTLALLVGLTVGLWAFATARHAFTRTGRERFDGRDAHRFVERTPRTLRRG